MLSPELVQIAVMALAGMATAGIVYVFVFPYVSGEKKAEQRMGSIAQDDASGRVARTVPARGEGAAGSERRKQVQDSLKEIEKKKKKKRPSLRIRLERAGLAMSTRKFGVVCFLVGLGFAVLVLSSGSPAFVALGAGFAGGFGLPQWFLSFKTKRRQKKFIYDLPNAVDTIVRGTKAGLTVNDSIKIIAREMQEPIKSEFALVAEGEVLGITLQKGLERMYERMPIQEVSFLAIVMAITGQTGGNISEALSNLSTVLRDRKKLKAKVVALSQEAKAGATIIGSLPIGFMIVLYFMQPEYLMLMFTERLGNIMLAGSAIWMTIGILVMKKMISFRV